MGKKKHDKNTARRQRCVMSLKCHVGKTIQQSKGRGGGRGAKAKRDDGEEPIIVGRELVYADKESEYK